MLWLISTHIINNGCVKYRCWNAAFCSGVVSAYCNIYDVLAGIAHTFTCGYFPGLHWLTPVLADFQVRSQYRFYITVPSCGRGGWCDQQFGWLYFYFLFFLRWCYYIMLQYYKNNEDTPLMILPLLTLNVREHIFRKKTCVYTLQIGMKIRHRPTYVLERVTYPIM